MSSQRVRFPPLMLERMLIYYTRVIRAILDADKDRTGRVGRQQFTQIFKTFSVDIDEGFVQVMDAFDVDGRGVNHKQFLEAVSERLFPPKPKESMSLIIPPFKFHEEKGRGRAKDFPTLQTPWNNNYYQTLHIEPKDEMCDGATAKPVLQSIIAGKFYNVSPVDRIALGMPKYRKVAGLIVDQDLDQPMSKSLMEGAYYNIEADELHPSGARTARTTKDFIQRNRTLTRSYSRLVTGARSSNMNAEGGDRTGTPRNTGPFHKLPRPATKQMRMRSQDFPTPRNADELQDMWARSLDPKFIATTMAWLKTATPEERAQFKIAIANHPTLVPSRLPVYPDRAYKSTESGAKLRPNTAHARVQGDTSASENAEPDTANVLGTFIPDGNRPQSARVTTMCIEPSAIAAATAFARSRPVASPRATGPEYYLSATPRIPGQTKGTSGPRPQTVSDEPPTKIPSVNSRQGPGIMVKGSTAQMHETSAAVSPQSQRTPRAGQNRFVTVVQKPQSANKDVHAALQVLSLLHLHTFVIAHETEQDFKMARWISGFFLAFFFFILIVISAEFVVHPFQLLTL